MYAYIYISIRIKAKTLGPFFPKYLRLKSEESRPVIVYI